MGALLEARVVRMINEFMNGEKKLIVEPRVPERPMQEVGVSIKVENTR